MLNPPLLTGHTYGFAQSTSWWPTSWLFPDDHGTPVWGVSFHHQGKLDVDQQIFRNEPLTWSWVGGKKAGRSTVDLDGQWRSGLFDPNGVYATGFGSLSAPGAGIAPLSVNESVRFNPNFYSYPFAPSGMGLIPR